MQRNKIDSAAAHSVGHDPTGMEVEYHAGTCASKRQEACDCGEGTPRGQGNVYHFPTVDAKIHSELMAAKSFGQHFAIHIRGKHTGTRR